MASVLKLVDIFGTAYFYKSLVKDLDYLFDTASRALINSAVKGNYYYPALNEAIEQFKRDGNITIDLSGAHFSRDTEPILRNAVSRYGVHFVNTDDEDMNNLLEENRRRLWQTYRTTPIPLPEHREDINQQFMSKIIKSSEGIVWTVNPKNADMSYSLLALLIMAKPDIDVDLGEGHYHRFFEYVFKNAGVSRMYNERRYVYTIVDSLCFADVTVTVNSRGNEERTVNVVGDGIMTVQHFVGKYMALPAEFGVDYILQKSPWRDFARKCHQDILALLEPKKSILDYFPRKEV